MKYSIRVPFLDYNEKEKIYVFDNVKNELLAPKKSEKVVLHKVVTLLDQK